MALSPRQQIASVDKAIDALRREVPNRQARHERECALFAERGRWQLERDNQERAALLREARRYAPRSKKCPTCGQRSAA